MSYRQTYLDGELVLAENVGASETTVAGAWPAARATALSTFGNDVPLPPPAWPVDAVAPAMYRREQDVPAFQQVAPTVYPYETLPRGSRLYAGLGGSTVLPDMDFETYSEAGFVWNEGTQKWEGLPGAPGNKKGLPVVGMAVYAEHASTDVLMFSYDLKDGLGSRTWLPGMPNPQDLFDYLAQGGLVEAWNVGFEYWIWNRVCVRRYGWPPLNPEACRCAAAKSRSFSLPGSLAGAGDVLNLAQQKNKDGMAYIKKFSMPRNPTAKDKRKRITIYEDPQGQGYIDYNRQDIVSEAHASALLPDLEGDELANWLLDQRINRRGVAVDVAAVGNCCAIIEQAHKQYNSELYALTGGEVARASELAKTIDWLAKYGVYMDSLDEEAIDEALALDDKRRTNAFGPMLRADVKPLHPTIRRVLEIRGLVGSAAVKKAFAMRNTATLAGRIHELYIFYGARTGRTTGGGVQPTNMPNSGPEVMACACCGNYSGAQHVERCPWCNMPQPPGKKLQEWGPEAVESALRVIATRDLRTVEHYFGDAMAAVSGCLRGLFVAAQGYELICSDYSAIEAVVLAMIAREQWRIDVFRTHGKIYEASAASISGTSFESFMHHAGYTDAELAAPDWYKRKPAVKGSHHPLRKTIGKVAELASGYQGWIGAWKAFGAEEFMTEDEMKKAILAWRAASPNIVAFWGGQSREVGYRSKVPHLHGVEGMFVAAVLNPGQEYEYNGFKFLYAGDVLYLRLLSGRYLAYHRPRLSTSTKTNAEAWEYSISYEGNNTNPKNGGVGFIRMDTWGGRLTENIVQATARDLQWFGMRNLEAAGYPIVLHVYDENIAEVPVGFGSVEEFERIMSTMPPWAHDWPVKASGGWRRPRYGKD